MIIIVSLLNRPRRLAALQVRFRVCEHARVPRRSDRGFGSSEFIVITPSSDQEYLLKINSMDTTFPAPTATGSAAIIAKKHRLACAALAAVGLPGEILPIALMLIGTKTALNTGGINFLSAAFLNFFLAVQTDFRANSWLQPRILSALVSKYRPFPRNFLSRFRIGPLGPISFSGTEEGGGIFSSFFRSRTVFDQPPHLQ